MIAILCNLNLINPNTIIQNPLIIIGIDMNKEYSDRNNVLNVPIIIRINPIIKSLNFIFLYYDQLFQYDGYCLFGLGGFLKISSLYVVMLKTAMDAIITPTKIQMKL